MRNACKLDFDLMQADEGRNHAAAKGAQDTRPSGETGISAGGAMFGLANEAPLASLKPSPDFTRTADASRACTETVTYGADLPAALDRAIRIATEEQRHVLLNIAIES